MITWRHFRIVRVIPVAIQGVRLVDTRTRCGVILKLHEKLQCATGHNKDTNIAYVFYYHLPLCSMSCAAASTALHTPLLRLQRILTPAEHQDFQFTSLDDLLCVVENIQRKQVMNKSLQCLIKIKPFLESMEQYGKVIEVFLNVTNLLAFVWVYIPLLE